MFAWVLLNDYIDDIFQPCKYMSRVTVYYKTLNIIPVTIAL